MAPFFAELVRLGVIIEASEPVVENFSARTTHDWAESRKAFPDLVFGVWAASGITPSKNTAAATHGKTWEAANRARHPSGAVAFEELLAARGVWNRGCRAADSVTEALKQYMMGRVVRSSIYSKELYSMDGMKGLGLDWGEAVAVRIQGLLLDNQRENFARMFVQFSVGWKVDWEKLRLLMNGTDGGRVRNLLPGRFVDGWQFGVQCPLLASDRFIQQVRTNTLQHLAALERAGTVAKGPMVPPPPPAASTAPAAANSSAFATDDATAHPKKKKKQAASAGAQPGKSNHNLERENIRLKTEIARLSKHLSKKDELLLKADVRIRKLQEHVNRERSIHPIRRPGAAA
eukprot:CAMPEP_0179457930 /NCGR_PEP_ID=MMETSP0799-20121207/41578_1 /TAXON_ID=46947 /ORGANISM="Geminigera cryophila, Strain CCMP2564" /LENGTH=345 /DNA_ID=CAMNT_0021258869 /DNA_START=25 /DNA_END=1059 /DNA_ORIENTATION=-